MYKTVDVLLIDDCDASCKVTSAAIRRAAPTASLVRVKHGEQALRLIFDQGLLTHAPHIPRLIVLAWNVSNPSGDLVLRRLRETSAPAIPVIVLTATSDRHSIAESYALGARECLVKSRTADYLSQMAQAVQRHL